MTKKFALSSALVAATLGFCGLAQAQQAGTWMFRVGAMSIIPQVSSGDLTAPSPTGVKIDVDKSTTLAGGISYMLTDNWSLDLPLAVPPKHKIKGDGTIAGSGEIATTRVVPATMFLQYRFREAEATWRPYVGAGLTYARFYGEKGNGTLTAITDPGGSTTLSIKSEFAPTVQAGMTYSLTPKIFLDGWVGKTFLKVRSTLSTGQHIDTKLDPVIVGLSVGYRY
jgi:outer membrane protein